MLINNQISDTEFQLIMTEFSQYNVLKEAVRDKLTCQTSQPDVEKIEQEIRGQERHKAELTFENM